MQLNKNHREEFVRRVMADVPQIDYKTQADDFARKELAKLRKAAGLEAIDNARLALGTVVVVVAQETDTERCRVPDNVWRSKERYFDLCRVGQYGVTGAETNSLEKHPKLLELRGKYIAQQNERAELVKRIRAAIDGCVTLAQAKKALPEFDKYLPQETVKVDRSLPVVGNLVAELSKKGWPKK